MKTANHEYNVHVQTLLMTENLIMLTSEGPVSANGVMTVASGMLDA